MVLFFPTGHKTQSDDGSEKSDGLRKIALNGRRHGNIFFIREKVIMGDCVRDKKGVGNLTADRRPIG